MKKNIGTWLCAAVVAALIGSARASETVTCEVKTVPCVIDTAVCSWDNQQTTKPDAKWACLFKNALLSEVVGLSATSYRAFGSYNFDSQTIDRIYVSSPTSEVKNFENDGFYFVKLAEDGQSMTFQVQHRSQQLDSGDVLGVEFVKLEQRGSDVYGAVVGIKYVYNGIYGEDALTKDQNNSCKYYYDDEEMNVGHVICNFSLQDLALTIEKHEIPEIRTVTVLGFEGEDLGEIVLGAGEFDATSRMPSAEDMQVEGYVFLGWNVAVDNVLKDMTVSAVYELVAVPEATYTGYLSQDDKLILPGYHFAGVRSIEGRALSSYSKNAPKDIALTTMYEAPSKGVVADGVYLFEKSVNEAGETVVTAEFQWICSYMQGIRVELVDHEDGIHGRITDFRYMYNRTTAKAYGETIVGAQDFGSYLYNTAFGNVHEGIVAMALHDLKIVGVEYREVKLTVRFEDINGNVLLVDGVATQELSIGTAAKAPTPPAREGYRFIGWDHDISVVTDNWVVRPLYRAEHTVTFVDFDGSVLKTESVLDGDGATSPDMTGRMDGKRVFWGWDSDFASVVTDMTVTAQYAVLKDCLINAPFELEAEEVYLPKTKLSKVLGVKANIRMKYGSYNQALELSSFEPCTLAGFVTSGVYAFKKSKDEISFELRGHSTVWGYDGIADACKIVLRQVGEDVVGTVVWAMGGCYATQYIGLKSWDSKPQFGYSSGFGYNNWKSNYTITIDELKLVTDVSARGFTILVR